MGASDSKAAENYAGVVNNSLTNIVNDVAMECESNFSARNRIIISADFSDSTNVNAHFDLNQNNLAVVSASCLANSEVYNVASSTIANDIEQTAKAIQAGFIPPPSVANTTEVVNSVSQQILNTYHSECVNNFSSENTVVAHLNASRADNLNLKFDVSQGNSSTFVSECISENITTTDAFQSMSTLISQIAETESKSVLFYIIILVIVLAAFMVVVYFFGKDFATWLLKTGGATFFLIFVGLSIFFGAAILFQWLTGAGMFGTTREEEPYTIYDMSGEYDKEDDTFVCQGGIGAKIPGFLNCVDAKLVDGNLETSGDDVSEIFYSYWCGGDSQTFDNFRLDFDYFKPVDGEYLDNNGKLTEEWRKKLSRLPPQAFNEVLKDEWPVDTFTVRIGGENGKDIYVWLLANTWGVSEIGMVMYMVILKS